MEMNCKRDVGENPVVSKTNVSSRFFHAGEDYFIVFIVNSVITHFIHLFDAYSSSMDFFYSRCHILKFLVIVILNFNRNSDVG